MKKRFVTILIVMTFLAGAHGPLFAASPWTESDGYIQKAKHKWEFGLGNVLFGWVELFYAPDRAYESGENVPAGIIEGIFNSVICTAGGVVHAGTFLIPVDIPLPGGGVNPDIYKPSFYNPNQISHA